MVKEQLKFYLIENDHKLAEFCHEHNTSPNSLSIDQFMDIAEDIGWVMTAADYEMHLNTRTLPDKYFIRIVDVSC
jgi:hypothetical protein